MSSLSFLMAVPLTADGWGYDQMTRNLIQLLASETSERSQAEPEGEKDRCPYDNC